MARLCLLLLLAAAPRTEGETSAQLRQRLLSNYGDAATRPGEAAATRSGNDTCSSVAPPEDVEVQLYIEAFLPINTLKQTWGFVAYTRAWWRDERLAYNGTAHGGCTDELHLDPSDLFTNIWAPTFYWERARSITLPTPPKKDRGELVHVYPSGDVWWSSQAEFVISCPMVANLGPLPFDSHTCNFLMGMYSDSDHRVRVRWKGYDPNDASAAAVALVNWDGACMAEWQAYDMTQEQVMYEYATSNFTYASAKVHFARTPGVWVAQYLVPAFFLVGLSYLGFFIDPKATPARIGLGITSVLVVIINLQSLLRVIPTTVKQPWISQFVMDCLLFNVIALVEQVLVSYGVSIVAWMEAERKDLKASVNWRKFLFDKVDEIGDLFKQLDRNGDGFLSKTEYTSGLMALGIELDTAEFHKIFDEMDVDGDGQISYDELEIEMVRVLGKGLPTQEQRSNGPKKEPTSLSTKRATKTEGADTQRVEPGEVMMVTVDSIKVDRPQSVRRAAAALELSDGASTAKSEKAAESQRPASGTTTAEKSSALSAKRNQYNRDIAAQHQRGCIWRIKYYTLFPALKVILLRLDHYSRVVFPVAFGIFVLGQFSKVGFGTAHNDLLNTVQCYRDQL